MLPVGLLDVRFATNLQLVKTQLSAKRNKAKHNKTRYACMLHFVSENSDHRHNKYVDLGKLFMCLRIITLYNNKWLIHRLLGLNNISEMADT